MSYTSASAADRLAAVRQKIDEVLTGSVEYSIRSRRARNAELSQLMELESRLMEQVASTAGGRVHLVHPIGPRY